MKIAFIAPSYIPSRRANTIQTMKMAQAFTQLGHDVIVISPGNAPEIDWAKDIKPHYGLTERFELAWVTSNNIFRGYDFALKSLKIANRWGADLIFTRHPQASALASQRGIATIFEAHNLPSGRMGPIFFRRFLNGSGCKGVVSISNALLKALEANYELEGVSSVIAPDGVDLARFQSLPSPTAARQELGLVDKFTVGYTGHFYKGRGIEIILEMAQNLPDLQFLLIGGNPEDIERISNHLEENNITNVVLTGFISNDILPKYQAASNLLLMPYQKEISGSSGGNTAAFFSPIKLFEYMAVGRPILSSDMPVLREVLDERNSILLPPADSEKWAETIKELEADQAKRESLGKIVKELSKEYSWQSRAEKILKELIRQ